MKQFLLVLMLGFLTACATMEGKIAAGYATAEAVNRGATQLLREKKMSSKDAQNVLTTTQSVRQGLDIARTLDPKAMESKAAAQLALLQALQKYLAEKGAK